MVNNFRFEVLPHIIGQQGQTKRQSMPTTQEIVFLNIGRELLHRVVFPTLDRVPKPTFVDNDAGAVAALFVVQMIQERLNILRVSKYGTSNNTVIVKIKIPSQEFCARKEARTLILLANDMRNS